ncbi:hypothetical protein MARHY2885 [Marinobacter nauticus ATCC 49840]|nr:hypothetical protein MARHY2885 [Marinobacter nauticus ATCC 49840]
MSNRLELGPAIVRGAEPKTNGGNNRMETIGEVGFTHRYDHD